MSESGNILDSAEVDFLIDSGCADTTAQESAPPGSDEQAVTMRGDLEQINLSDIFQTLSLTKMEGVLRVHNPLEQRQVYCNEGYVRILVPARVATRRLGQRLVQAGLIPPEQLRSALLRQRRDPQPLGSLLVAEGLVTQDQVDEIAGMQVAEDLFALFTWRHGAFEFWKGPVADAELQKRFESCPEFEVSSLLLEVARRSDEWESILAVICGLDEVPARIADVPAGRELGEIQRALVFGADGRLTWRQLAEQTTHGLFEVARVARDLVREGWLANVGDEELLAVAENHADSQRPKQALMLLQTLRDRPGQRPLPVLNRLVGVLDKSGERRLAGAMLLEIAQQQTDPQVALPLARRARELAPNDAGTISFLRTTLLAHQAPDSAELARCTFDLLDALLAIDRADTAIEIVAEVRAAGAPGPQLLVREARARQKAGDAVAAANVMVELAQFHRDQGDRKRALEAYEGALRLDRGRKDLQKLVRQLRQTRTDRIVRLAASVVACLLLGAMGFVLWDQYRLDAALCTAGTEVGELLRSGDRAAARERLEHWAEAVGGNEAIDDLRQQVDFADASEATRLAKLAQKRRQEKLTQAADTLAAGDLRSALIGYGELQRLPDARAEVTEVVGRRLDALLAEIEQVAKVLASRLPAPPTPLQDRREHVAILADLQAACRPVLLRLVDELGSLHDGGALPTFLAEAQRARIAAVLADTREVFERARGLSRAYAAALQRSDTQRRLDPLFKEARRLEDAHDFAGALRLYEQIVAAEAGEGEVLAFFRERIARNTAICAAQAAAAAATASGDFATARQHYLALRRDYADVPFDRLVRLPLAVTSRPPGALVRCNGSELGRTPCRLSFLPADENLVAIGLPGFRTETVTVTGDGTGEVHVDLQLEPRLERRHENSVEVPPAVDADGRVLIVDRGGVVTALRRDGSEAWSHRTGDLSGLLSRPFLHGPHVVFASLDGELRALDRARGTLAWSLPDLPTEVGPALAGGHLLLATTDRRLVAVDLASHTATTVSLSEAPTTALLAVGGRVFFASDEAVVACTVPTLAAGWRRPLPDFGDKTLVAAGAHLVVGDDRGHLALLDAADGTVRWTRRQESPWFGAPAVYGDRLLLACADRIATVALADGADRPAFVAGEHEFGGALTCSRARLVAPLRSGTLAVFGLDSGHALYRIEGQKRGAAVLTGDGIVAVCLPDRRILFFDALP